MFVGVFIGVLMSEEVLDGDVDVFVEDFNVNFVFEEVFDE